MAQRIGLLTLPLEVNYGGLLQAATLYQVLTSELKKDVVFLEREHPEHPSRLRRTMVALLKPVPSLTRIQKMLDQQAAGGGWPARLLATGFSARLRANIAVAVRQAGIERHLPFRHRFISNRSTPLASTQDMANAVRHYGLETLVVGSDQVWRMDYLPDDAREDYFFGFASSPEIRKISYAASFGHGEWNYPELTARMKPLLGQFDAISVREASGVEICATVFDRPDARHVLDPTLLIDPAFYETAAAPATRKAGKLLLSYVLDEEPDRPAVSRELLTALGPDYSIRSLTLDMGTRPLDVPGWLRAFKDADFIITDSFHGMVFSIIFRKRFIAILNRKRGADRFLSLLGALGLLGRLVADPDPKILQALAATPIDYATVTWTLAKLRAESLAFLRQALQ